MITESERSSLVRSEIESMPKKLKDHFLICKSCRGRGLDGVMKLNQGGFAWNGKLCKRCNGVGYIPDNEIFFICKKCEGRGCSSCSNSGYVDWSQKARGM